MPADFIVNSALISTPGNLRVDGQAQTPLVNLGGSLATAQAIVTGNTITIPATGGLVRLTLAGAATGVIMPVGSFHGQLVMISISTAAANTLTMAAAGTSNVAAGTTCVLAGLNAHLFVWDNAAALWFQVGPATN